MRGLLLLLALGAAAQTTRIAPGQVRWSQVNLSACAARPAAGTNLALNQIAVTSTDACWPQTLAREGRSVLNARCVRCHGGDLVPGDTHLVGGLDLRYYPAMLRGGKRGRALAPGDAMGSLIYLFASRFQLGSGVGGNTAVPPMAIQTTMGVQSAGFPVPLGFRVVPPDSREESVAMPPFFPMQPGELQSLRNWVQAGAPITSDEIEPITVKISIVVPARKK